jgi:hypothetical protein
MEETQRFLETGTGTLSTEFLGFHPSGVSDEESSVVLNEHLSESEGGGSV